MPTPPPSRPDPQPHRHRRVAESFGVDAARYDRARPRYPEALIDRIVARAPGREVLDVGCGTGIAARQFAAAGCRVLGVEPDVRMAEFARGSGLDVEVATFEEWDDAGRQIDAVVAGQAWHWVDPAAGPVKAARLLRPGGRLAVFAQVIGPPSPVYEAQVEAVRRVAPDSPFVTQGAAAARDAVPIYESMIDTFAAGMRPVDELGEPERSRFDWERTYTRAEWLDLAPTTGVLTPLPPERVAEVLEQVGAAIEAIGGSFVMRYTALSVSALRT